MRNMLHLRVVAGTGGGPEKTILNSPRFIREHGYNAKVVYLIPSGDVVRQSLMDRARKSDCPLTILEDRGPTDLRVVRDILRICKGEKIDLIQSHDYKTNAIALLVRRFHHCKLATMLHGWTDMSGRMPIYKRIDQWCLPWFQKLICVSKDLALECKRLKIPDHKVHLVHNAIDTKEFSRRLSCEEAKASMGARANRFLIGSVGRLSPEKGFLDLIDVVKVLQDSGNPIDLWIAGDGPQRADLERRIESLGLQESVRLLGQLADTKAFYQAMDLFVLNSIREGLPNVILEAMALKVPVIATQIAGIPDLIRDQETGLLIAPNDRDGLKHAITRSMAEVDHGQEMVRVARQLIESEYSFDARMEKVAGIYDSMF
ncbi:MAG: glycosyltransferase family 4 protein [Planctomycetes bacterium]|nr:glycosyltransferase family 4 protein [Planctomycetota bacterium]